MAKISTYPPVGTPTLSDMLIGTEVTDDNATKNFMISDILGLIGSLGLYVPYTGATANVDLGSFSLSSTNVTYTGSLLAAVGSVSVFGDTVIIEGELRDGFNQPGTAGQILSSTGTLTQWVSLSSLSLNLQQVLDDGNTANQDITLTGLSNQFSQSGNNAGITQSGTSSYLAQTGISAFILQIGADAFISQGGANSYISQIGVNAYIEQTGANAIIRQTGSGSAIEQTGSSAYIYQSGTNASFQQAGANTYIEQTGANSYISQTGANAYIQPSQIKDSTSVVGTAGQVLSSLGTGLGVKWVSPLSAVSFGSFYDSTNQTTATNVAAAMKFGTDYFSGFGVSVTADGLGNRTQIEVDESGVYNVQFSAQIAHGAGSGAVADIWFRLNGGNIANSNTSISLQSNTNEVASWNYFIDLNPGDTFQIMWTHNGSVSLAAAAASAPRPATPSVILTVNRII
jgi:hypothetical protein